MHLARSAASAAAWPASKDRKVKTGPNVKSDAKVFASLSSGLLARKGAARPAMRPQGFGQGGGALEDLGWDDMGFEPPRAATLPLRDETHDAFGEEFEEQPDAQPGRRADAGRNRRSIASRPRSPTA